MRSDICVIKTFMNEPKNDPKAMIALIEEWAISAFQLRNDSWQQNGYRIMISSCKKEAAPCFLGELSPHSFKLSTLHSRFNLSKN